MDRFKNLAPEKDIADGSTEFLDAVKDVMQSVLDDPGIENYQKQEKELKIGYKYFYDYAKLWAAAERKKTAKISSHADALALRKQAVEVLAKLQANIVRYAACYMRLNRGVGTIQGELKVHGNLQEEKQDFKWTSDTETLMKRYIKEWGTLYLKNKSLAEGLVALESVEDRKAALEDAAVALFGEEGADEALRSFRSNIRSGRFDMAEKALNGIGEAKKKFSLDSRATAELQEKIAACGKEYMKAVESGQENLVMEDGKLYVKAMEVRSILKHNIQEMGKHKAFIMKYFVPYIESKLKSLGHLKDKLLVVGSLEGLQTLYIRLMRGLAQPMPDIKAVREYESEVIERVNYLLSGQFQEIDNIDKRNMDTMKDFVITVKNYNKIMDEGAAPA